MSREVAFRAFIILRRFANSFWRSAVLSISLDVRKLLKESSTKTESTGRFWAMALQWFLSDKNKFDPWIAVEIIRIRLAMSGLIYEIWKLIRKLTPYDLSIIFLTDINNRARLRRYETSSVDVCARCDRYNELETPVAFSDTAVSSEQADCSGGPQIIKDPLRVFHRQIET